MLKKVLNFICDFFISIYMWTVLFWAVIYILIVNIIRVIFRDKRIVFKKCQNDLKRLFKILFIKVESVYHPDLDKNSECIIMPNHVSFFDVPLVGSLLPNFTFGIEAEHHFKWPLYGYFIRKYGQLPINRKSMMSSLRTFEKAADYMRETGASLLVFPEGHRSDDGKIQQLKKLPFKMALMMKVPIVPVGLTGMSNLSPKGFFLKPCPVKVYFGKPIHFEEYGNLKPEEIAQIVRQRIIDLCDDDIA